MSKKVKIKTRTIQLEIDETAAGWTEVGYIFIDNDGRVLRTATADEMEKHKEAGAKTPPPF